MLQLWPLLVAFLYSSLSQSYQMPNKSDISHASNNFVSPKTEAAQYFFKNVKSYMEFDSGIWSSNAAYELTFIVTTHSYDGHLASILVTNPNTGDRLYEIRVAVKHRALIAIALAATDLGDISLGSIILNEELSDGNAHSIKVRLERTTLYLEQNSTERRISLKPEVASDEFKTALHVGSNYQSFIGCIHGLIVTTNSTPIRTRITAKDAVQDMCPVSQLCPKKTCGSGETSMISFKAEDGYLQYTLPAKDDQIVFNERRQPQRIVFNFKTVVPTEQLLFVASLTSIHSGAYATMIRIFHTPKRIRLQTDETELFLNITEGRMLNDNRFHSLELKLMYNKRRLYLFLDSNMESLISWDIPSFVEFTDAMFFGGSDLVGMGTGIIGCMKDIYVEYHSILAELEKGTDGGVSISADMAYPDDLSCPEFAALEKESDDAGMVLVDPPKNSKAGNSTVVQSTDILPVLRMDDADKPTSEPVAVTEVSGLTQNTTVTVGPVSDYYSATENDELVYDNITNSIGGLGETQTVKIEPSSQVPFNLHHKTETTSQYNCSDDTSVGGKCQFTSLPRSCEELFLFGEQRSGIYQIDVDGSGPLVSSLVRCIMKSTEGTAVTSVDNNFPNDTMVRSLGTGSDSTYKIEYRIPSEVHLTALASASHSCFQYVKYECMKAPLGFNKITWFTSVGHQSPFGRIGDNENHCSDKPCNCDVIQRMAAVDEGYLTGRHAGIRSVTILQIPHSNWAKLSIGPLQCSGIAGFHKPVTISDPASSIILNKVWNGNEISFWIRTSSIDGNIATINSNNVVSIILSLHNSQTVKVSFIRGTDSLSATTVMKITCQTVLTDSRWHRIKLDVSHDEAMLSVDSQYGLATVSWIEDIKWQNIMFGSPDGVLGQSSGFVGCLRSLVIDGISEDLHQHVTGNEGGISLGCTEHCNVNPCQNNGKCREDYYLGTYECICENRWTHSGSHCEKDLNIGGEVTLYDHQLSYLKFTNLEQNPLMESIILSFRTDKHSALILYAHDHLYNFAQVTIISQHIIRLTVNYGTEIKQCTIVGGTEGFSHMHWNQLIVSYSDDRTSLIINGLECSIDGGRIMSDVYINDFTHGKEHETVVPPHVPYQSNDMKQSPYNILFLGGLPQPSLGRGQRRHTGNTYYFTDLYHLQGCFRGLKVGSTVVDLHDVKWFSDPSYVKTGCQASCDNVRCANGGQCHIAWEDGGKGSCDCSLTSYVGLECDEENGLQFSGGAILQINTQNARQIMPELLRDVSSISFAFSSSYRSKLPQMLFTMTFKNNTRFDVYITADGNVCIRLEGSGIEGVHYGFEGNFLDDNRHFVYIELSHIRHAISIAVDNIFKIMEIGPNIANLRHIYRVTVGGLTDDNEIQDSEFASYIGCLSNLVLVIGTDQYQPIKSYLTGTVGSSNGFITAVGSQDALIASQCSNFSAAPVASYPDKPMLTLPEWNPTLAIEPYDPNGNVRGDGSNVITPLNNMAVGGGIHDITLGMHPAKIAAMIFGTLFIITLISGIFYMTYRGCNRKVKSKRYYNFAKDSFRSQDEQPSITYTRHNHGHEEKEPLRGNEAYLDPKPYYPSTTPYTPGSIETPVEEVERPIYDYRPDLPSSAPAIAAADNHPVDEDEAYGPAAQSDPSLYQPSINPNADSVPFSDHFQYQPSHNEYIDTDAYSSSEPLTDMGLSPHEFI